MAEKLVQKLEKCGRREEYEGVLIEEYFQLDAIEKEPELESKGFYMPHHAVMREEATTSKKRVVFNPSSSKIGGRSLYDTIDPGRSLLPDLVGLMLRFRELPAAVQTDIRKAFLLISVREDDRKYLRFVWSDNEGHCVTWRLKKLPFGVNRSPFILNLVVQHHLEAEMKIQPVQDIAALELLRKSLYVHDCVASLPLSRMWTISSKAARPAWPVQEWNSENGEGTPSLKMPEPVRRSLVSPGTQRWTPFTLHAARSTRMGHSRGQDGSSCVRWRRCLTLLLWSSATHLNGKILLQRAWQETSSWDQPLGPQLAACVKIWRGELQHVKDVSFARWIHANHDTPMAVHVFPDASEKAYGCCIYIVVGQTSHLVFF